MTADTTEQRARFAWPRVADLGVADLAGIVAIASLCIGSYPMLLFRSYTATCAVLVALAPLGLLALIRAASSGDRPSVAASALIMWVLISSLFTGAPVLALKGTVGRDASGLIIVAVIAVWAYARSMGPSARRLVPHVVVCLLAICGLAGVVQVVFNVTSGSLPLQFGRATGFMPNPVYFGGLMAGAGAMAAMVSAVPDRIRWIMVAFFGACTNLSGSRIAAVAGLLALAAFALLDRRLTRAVVRRLVPLAMFIVGLLVAAVVGPMFSDVASSTSRGVGEGGGRLQAWRYGLSAVADKPIAGWGFGRFRAATQARFSAEFVRAAASDDVRQAWFDAHNIFINIAVASGVVGFAIVLWWIWTSRRVERASLAFGATLALTWLAQPAGLATLPLVAIVWGAGAVGAPVREGDAGDSPIARRRHLDATLLAIGLVGASVVVVADIGLRRALDSGDAARVESAAKWFPRDSVVADLVAQAWFQAEQDDPSLRPRVIEWSKRAVEREPDRPYLWSRLGLRQEVFGERAAAIGSVERALELQPWHLQSWQILYAIGKGSDDRALIDRSSTALCSLGQEIEECQPTSG